MNARLLAAAVPALFVLAACSDNGDGATTGVAATNVTTKSSSSIDWSAIRAAQKNAPADDAKALAALRKGPSCLRSSGGVAYWFLPKKNAKGQPVCGTSRAAYDEHRTMLALNSTKTRWVVPGKK